MKKAKKAFSIILIAVTVFLLGFEVCGARKIQEMKARTGTALYSNYKGKAVITKVKQTENSKAQAKVAGRSAGYEVWFTFEPEPEAKDEDERGEEDEAEDEEQSEEIIKESWGRRFVGGEHLFKLANGLYPNAKYIKKYNVKPGKEYECTFRVMKQGTGTPFIFVINGLPKDDFSN